MVHTRIIPESPSDISDSDVIIISQVHCVKLSSYSLFINSADVDECSPLPSANSSMATCEHQCTNTDGSFFCACDEGFVLAVDGQSCLGMLHNYAHIRIHAHTTVQ